MAAEAEKLSREKRKERKDPARVTDPKPLSPGSKAKIRDIMSVLFNHAIRWNIYSANPISGPSRKVGVRQSGMRQETPDTLELDMVSMDMIAGIRRSELQGLQ